MNPLYNRIRLLSESSVEWLTHVICVHFSSGAEISFLAHFLFEASCAASDQARLGLMLNITAPDVVLGLNNNTLKSKSLHGCENRDDIKGDMTRHTFIVPLDALLSPQEENIIFMSD